MSLYNALNVAEFGKNFLKWQEALHLVGTLPVWLQIYKKPEVVLFPPSHCSDLSLENVLQCGRKVLASLLLFTNIPNYSFHFLRVVPHLIAGNVGSAFLIPHFLWGEGQGRHIVWAL